MPAPRSLPGRNPGDARLARARRKPWVSAVLLAAVMALWYRYWIGPAATWLWGATHHHRVTYLGHAIAVPRNWYAKWLGGTPELRRLAVPLAQDATISIVPIRGQFSAGANAFDYFHSHDRDFAANAGFPITSIRTLQRGTHNAFCLQGSNIVAMNSECAITGLDFALLLKSAPGAAPDVDRDFDAVLRSLM